MAKKRQSFFTLNELKNDVFAVTENERYVFMPNEIFTDLLDRFKDEEKAKSKTHIAFAYAYTYLAHYMYRYCKHYYGELEEKEINEAMIKQILGFPAKSDHYTYITKKGGILDELGYIRKEGDKPISFYLSEEENGIREITHFSMESEYPEICGNRKNRKINFPVKAFHRDKESIEDKFQDGTFWQIENTHNVEVDIFMYCMSQPELGVEGFYLYSFLLFMCDKHNNSFDCSYTRFIESTGLSNDIIKAQLRNLEERNMIRSDHKPYCLNRPIGQQTKANTYNVNRVKSFANYKWEYVVIPKQRKVNAENYEKEIGWVSGEYEYRREELVIDLPIGLS